MRLWFRWFVALDLYIVGLFIVFACLKLVFGFWFGGCWPFDLEICWGALILLVGLLGWAYVWSFLLVL